ncbi:hypothetical protein Ciccas_013802 [Cichlidogyrus casuarinus]|uniref:Uncharacterized protein n=1 Tax=Cichlidogyrus casuarinus TaxID=1844966 RepID=A0ABD2PJQ3_9PLAT
MDLEDVKLTHQCKVRYDPDIKRWLANPNPREHTSLSISSFEALSDKSFEILSDSEDDVKLNISSKASPRTYGIDKYFSGIGLSHYTSTSIDDWLLKPEQSQLVQSQPVPESVKTFITRNELDVTSLDEKQASDISDDLKCWLATYQPTEPKIESFSSTVDPSDDKDLSLWLSTNTKDSFKSPALDPELSRWLCPKTPNSVLEPLPNKFWGSDHHYTDWLDRSSVSLPTLTHLVLFQRFSVVPLDHDQWLYRHDPSVLTDRLGQLNLA